ncbi:MAG: arylsulfatase [Spirochaetes bacterium]|nr:arylsulfatase [Spirochaetota bacterium]
MADRPNIVILQVDQWRADCLGFAGHPTVETPHLDAFFRQGVNFSKAYAAVPSCIAARASIMTGLTPRSHGRVGYRDGVPWNYPVTLAGTLAAAGYHTQAVGKLHAYPERSLLGFHHVVLHDGYLHHSRSHGSHEDRDDYLPWIRGRRGPRADFIDTGMGCNGYTVAPWCYDNSEHPTAWVADESIDFLRRRDPSRPFFLYASFHRPHPPLDPPRDYLALYDKKELPPPLRGDWVDHPLRRGYFDSPVPVKPDEIDRARKAYYAQITFIDHQINRLTHALHERGVLSNTWILFVSDHGDMLYDHGHIAKALPYEGSARVPLLMRLPDSQKTLARGRQVDAPVELRDIFPTCCEIAGVAVPPSVEGKSLLPFARGEAPQWREAVHGEHEWGEGSNQWLSDGKTKYAWYSQTGREELFDLEKDPGEIHELSRLEPERLSKWRTRLAKELAGREEGYSDGTRLIPGKKATPVLACALTGA